MRARSVRTRSSVAASRGNSQSQHGPRARGTTISLTAAGSERLRPGTQGRAPSGARGRDASRPEACDTEPHTRKRRVEQGRTAGSLPIGCTGEEGKRVGVDQHASALGDDRKLPIGRVLARNFRRALRHRWVEGRGLLRAAALFGGAIRCSRNSRVRRRAIFFIFALDSRHRPGTTVLPSRARVGRREPQGIWLTGSIAAQSPDPSLVRGCRLPHSPHRPSPTRHRSACLSASIASAPPTATNKDQRQSETAAGFTRPVNVRCARMTGAASESATSARHKVFACLPWGPVLHV